MGGNKGLQIILSTYEKGTKKAEERAAAAAITRNRRLRNLDDQVAQRVAEAWFRTTGDPEYDGGFAVGRANQLAQTARSSQERYAAMSSTQRKRRAKRATPSLMSLVKLYEQAWKNRYKQIIATTKARAFESNLDWRDRKRQLSGRRAHYSTGNYSYSGWGLGTGMLRKTISDDFAAGGTNIIGIGEWVGETDGSVVTTGSFYVDTDNLFEAIEGDRGVPLFGSESGYSAFMMWTVKAETSFSRAPPSDFNDMVGRFMDFAPSDWDKIVKRMYDLIFSGRLGLTQSVRQELENFGIFDPLES